MQRINIVCFGKLKEAFWRDAVAEYSKRLNAFCKLTITEINEEPLSQKPSDKEIEQALEAEADIAMKYIPERSYVFALCGEGKEMPSEKLAAQIDDISAIGQGICFIIGSSYGLSNEVKKMADLRLSLSQMTFPHKLFRVMLLEQLYRGFMINQGSQYHK